MSASGKSPSRKGSAQWRRPGDIVMMSGDDVLPQVDDASPWSLRVLASGGQRFFRMRWFGRARARAGQELCAGLVKAAARLDLAETALYLAGWSQQDVTGTWRPPPRIAGFDVGDPVAKVGGDYSFEGEVRSVLLKRSGAVRYVVEDDRGVLHIFSAKQLGPRERARSA